MWSTPARMASITTKAVSAVGSPGRSSTASASNATTGRPKAKLSMASSGSTSTMGTPIPSRAARFSIRSGSPMR
jgi:hypothetical protein